MSTYAKGWALVFLGIAVGACGCSRTPSRNEVDWDDVAQWVGADVSDSDYMSFVRDQKLLMRHDVDCGVFADTRESYWINVRNKRVVRVAVRIRPVRPGRHAFAGKLISGIHRSDTAEDVIRKLGTPDYDVCRDTNGRYLLYEPEHIVFDFGADGTLFEIRLGSMDNSGAPNQSLDLSCRIGRNRLEG